MGRLSSTDIRTDTRSDTLQTPTDTRPIYAHCGGDGAERRPIPAAAAGAMPGNPGRASMKRPRSGGRTGALRGVDARQIPRSAMLAARRHVAATVNALEESRRSCMEYRGSARILPRPQEEEPARSTALRLAGSYALFANTHATGLGLDIFGFLVLFALAFPALMRRDFVTSDRVGLDGVSVDSGQVGRLMDPPSAGPPEQRRRRRQTCYYWAAGLAVLIGFALQFAALFVP